MLDFIMLLLYLWSNTYYLMVFCVIEVVNSVVQMDEHSYYHFSYDVAALVRCKDGYIEVHELVILDEHNKVWVATEYTCFHEEYQD